MFYSNFVPKFLRYSTCKYTLKPGLRVTQGHRKRHVSIRHLWLHINVPWQLWAYILYRFRDRRRFQSKIANFSHPVYFAPQPKGFPLKLSIGAWGQKTNHGATRPSKMLDDIFSRLDTMHERDGQTDRRTPDDSKDRAITHSVAR